MAFQLWSRGLSRPTRWPPSRPPRWTGGSGSPTSSGTAGTAPFLDGFSLHAGVRIHGNDREGRESLCRYALRPPLALQRLTQGEEGQLVYRMSIHVRNQLWTAKVPQRLNLDAPRGWRSSSGSYSILVHPPGQLGPTSMLAIASS